MTGWSFSRNVFSCGFAFCLILLGAVQARATIGIAYQMLLGNPSNATADTNDHNHYLIQRDIEALDYNEIHRQPNWASWHLTTSDLGSSGRTGTFFVDTSLPAGFYRVLTTDYSGSGYDRGHMCPSGDRTASVPINEETFLMSNMIPQSPDNNQGIWANLESYCRTLASAGNEVLITCGPEGFGTNHTASNGQIPIASNVWKIIVVVPTGSGDTLERIENTTRVIAVNIPNIQGIRTAPWQNYLTSVNQLQTNTGYTFFSALNSDLAEVLRARVDGAPACGITNFTPAAGVANSTVVIRGTNFTGSTKVRFNGQNAAFTQDSVNQITATVPLVAGSGPITVIAAGGLSTSATSFTINSLVVAQPRLSIAFDGQNIVLSWPANALSYSLEQSTDLNPANWVGYQGPVVINGASKTATLTAPSGILFFRLAAPVGP